MSEALDALPGWLAPYLARGRRWTSRTSRRRARTTCTACTRARSSATTRPGILPPLITLFRRPLVEDFGHEPAALRREVQITVAHELAHRFGFDEKRLDELGYG